MWGVPLTVVLIMACFILVYLFDKPTEEKPMAVANEDEHHACPSCTPRRRV